LKKRNGCESKHFLFFVLDILLELEMASLFRTVILVALGAALFNFALDGGDPEKNPGLVGSVS